MFILLFIPSNPAIDIIYLMASYGIEISLELRVAVVVCRLLYCESFDVIERRMGVNKRSAFALIDRFRKDFEDHILPTCG